MTVLDYILERAPDSQSNTAKYSCRVSALIIVITPSSKASL